MSTVICILPSKTHTVELLQFAYSQDVIITHWGPAQPVRSRRWDGVSQQDRLESWGDRPGKIDKTSQAGVLGGKNPHKLHQLWNKKNCELLVSLRSLRSFVNYVYVLFFYFFGFKQTHPGCVKDVYQITRRPPAEERLVPSDSNAVIKLCGTLACF